MVNQIKGAVPGVLRVGQHADGAFLQLVLNETHRNDGHTVIVKNSMLHCLGKWRLDPAPEFLAVDGNRFRTTLEIPWRCFVKGDGRFADIAAASVLAKTHRDEYMRRLDAEYPHYGWSRNKGYPTRDHRIAIRTHGLTPYHRLTFHHDIDQLTLPL